jgi:formate dehydrogenase subunit gamma
MENSSQLTIDIKAEVEAHNAKVTKRRRKHRIVFGSVFFILALAVALPMASYTAHWFGSTAVAQEGAATTNPRSNYWRAVKEGVQGYSAIGGSESGVLIQPGATEWQQRRDGALSQKAPWIIVGMAVLLLLYHLIHGRNKLDAPKTGRKIKRWSWLDRLVHWVTAISFIALAVTGISMLIGKVALIPLLGKAGFAAWAQLSLQIHNVLGPVFFVGISLMIILWIWYNFPGKADMQWLKAGGGMFKNNHPSAGRMNAGEKIWFWLLATLGIVVCLTGVAMVLPAYGIAAPAWAEALPWLSGSRNEMQQANILHGGLAVIWTAVALGHIYIGTAGTEGAFEGMATGYVSEEWALQHHDLWAEKMIAKGKVIESSLKGGTGAEIGAKPSTASSN